MSEKIKLTRDVMGTGGDLLANEGQIATAISYEVEAGDAGDIPRTADEAGVGNDRDIIYTAEIENATGPATQIKVREDGFSWEDGEAGRLRFLFKKAVLEDVQMVHTASPVQRADAPATFRLVFRHGAAPHSEATPRTGAELNVAMSSDRVSGTIILLLDAEAAPTEG